MSFDFARFIDAFANLRVLVLGDAMLDSYLCGSSHRLCQEAPAPIVDARERIDAAGGAANTAVNVAALGARVHLLSALGGDEEGAVLQRVLRDRGVATDSIVRTSGRRTLSKQRVLSDSQLLVRIDRGSTEPLSASAEKRLIRRLTKKFAACDAVIVSDYGYGVMTPGVIEALAELQAQAPRIVVADSKRLAAYRKIGLTAAKPNCREAAQLLGIGNLDPATRVEEMTRSGDKLLHLTGARLAALTLDTDGALIFERDQPVYRTYARPMPNSRAAGAGDTFVSAMTLALAAGAPTSVAAELASAAAAIVVSDDRTAACSAEELRVHVSTHDKHRSGIEGLASKLAGYRSEGRQIVFTNGCFDILHRGHIRYLNQAKALGDVLIVGVNSDSSIQRLKGPDRPINSVEDRVDVLSALSCIDDIVVFDDDTPCNLIRTIRPNVFVKGGDYTIDRLPEAALVKKYGGVVKILPFLSDRSTTGIIDRIRKVYGVPNDGRSASYSAEPGQ